MTTTEPASAAPAEPPPARAFSSPRYSIDSTDPRVRAPPGEATASRVWPVFEERSGTSKTDAEPEMSMLEPAATSRPPRLALRLTVPPDDKVPNNNPSALGFNTAAPPLTSMTEWGPTVMPKPGR